MAEVIGAFETRLSKEHILVMVPFDLAREPRWSRVEETFGEDPMLVAKLGVAFIMGFREMKLVMVDMFIQHPSTLQLMEYPPGDITVRWQMSVKGICTQIIYYHLEKQQKRE